MPRPSYEQYRAHKAAVEVMRRRQGSFIESETDLESLASQSTYLSNSSYLSNPSYLASQRYPNSAQHLVPPNLRQRTFSSTSRDSSSFSPTTHSPLSPLPHRSSRDGSIPLIEEREKLRKARAERRAKRIAEKEARSTLLAEKYDSVLRRWLRWMSKKGWSRASLPLLLVLVGGVRYSAGRYAGLRQSPAALPSYLDKLASPVDRLLSVLLGRLPQSASRSTMFATGTTIVTAAAELALWAAVIFSVTREGRKTGRSWRTQVCERPFFLTALLIPQVTGVLMILLNPATLVERVYDPALALSLATLILIFDMLKGGGDSAAISLFTLTSVLDSRLLLLGPVLVSFVFSKAMWLGGSNGMFHIGKAFRSAIAVVIPCLYSDVDGRPRILAAGALHKSVDSAKSAIQFPFVTIRIGIAVLLTIPVILIMIYSSMSLQTPKPPSIAPSIVLPDGSSKPAATSFSVVKLLPSAFFCSLTAAFVCLPRFAASFVLMPLLLQAAMRGGKEGSNGSGDDLWNLSCLLTLISTLRDATLDSPDDLYLRVSLLSLWSLLVGYSPFSVQPRWISHLTLIALALSCTPVAMRLAGLMDNPSAWTTDIWLLQYWPDVLLRSVYAIASGWGMRKLLQTAWAIGGLG